MGSLASRPKVPQVQTVVVQPTTSTATTTDTTSSSDSASDTSAANATSAEQTASEARADDLLRRNRGYTGTIVTGFRGLETSETANAAGRKALLGE